MKKSLKLLVSILLCISIITSCTLMNGQRTEAARALSKDWKSLEFKMNGDVYKVNFDFKQIKDNGWNFNLSDYGHDSYILNSGDKVTGTIYLKNKKYDSSIMVGFINTAKKQKDIKKCKVWSISIDNMFAKHPVSFNLPGGIKSGSTLKQVKSAYGKPAETYRSKDLGYWVYTYSYDFEKYFKVTVDDKKGVIAMSMELY